MSDNEVKYWKSEYENLRRKKNREIATLKQQISRFFDLTYKLLVGLGLKPEEITEYYRSQNE